MIDTREPLILQIMPKQVHSWWPCLRKCLHLSVNKAAVASCSLATIYQCHATHDNVINVTVKWQKKNGIITKIWSQTTLLLAVTITIMVE